MTGSTPPVARALAAPSRRERVRRFWLRTTAVAEKEVTHILRDRQILGVALILPVVLVVLFGYAVSFDVEHIPLVVVDQQRSATSRAIVDSYTSGDTFVVKTRRGAAEAVEPLFRSGVAKVALVLPPDLDHDLGRNQEARAQLLLDGSDNVTAAIAFGYAQALALETSREQMREVLDLLGADLEQPLTADIHTLFNPRLRSAVFLVPGLIVVVLALVAVMLTALTVAREYERGSMEQLFATPVGRIEVILGKLTPYFVIGMVQVLLVLVLGVIIFDVPVHGSLLLLFGAALLLLLAGLMQGLLISTLARNQILASMAAAISTLLPSLLLSGFIFPVDSMPWPLRAISVVVPARYFVEAIRAVLLRGNGIDVIGGDMVALAGFFLILLALAVNRFKRELG